MVQSYRGIEAPQLYRECSHPLPHQEVGVLKDAQAARMERSHTPELSQAFTAESVLPGDCVAMSPRRAAKSRWGGEVLWRAMGPLGHIGAIHGGTVLPHCKHCPRSASLLPSFDSFDNNRRSYVAAN